MKNQLSINMFDTWSCWKGCGRYAGKRNILRSLDVQEVLVQLLLFELLQLSQQIVLKHHMAKDKKAIMLKVQSTIVVLETGLSLKSRLVFNWVDLGF